MDYSKEKGIKENEVCEKEKAILPPEKNQKKFNDRLAKSKQFHV